MSGRGRRGGGARTSSSVCRIAIVRGARIGQEPVADRGHQLGASRLASQGYQAGLGGNIKTGYIQGECQKHTNAYCTNLPYRPAAWAVATDNCLRAGFSDFFGVDSGVSGTAADVCKWASRATIVVGGVKAGVTVVSRGSRYVATRAAGRAPVAAKAGASGPASRIVGNTTSAGVQRANPAEWRRLQSTWDDAGLGDVLSPANRARIEKGRTPRVDEDWVRHFPGDEALIGERVSMHHIGGSPFTVPLPATRHLDAHMPGGYRYNPGGPGRTG